MKKLSITYRSLATLGMTRGMLALTAAILAVASPRTLTAQKGQGNQDIPSGSRPPAGMCRIWLDNVPAAQQPAPTDCASAVRNRPAKGRVIFGDDYATKRTDTARTTTKTQGTTTKTQGTTTKTNPGIKGFAPAPSKVPTKKRPLALP
jgi:hypothetical protein